MSIFSFFNILSAGYIKHYRDNRIFLNEFYTDRKDERQKYDLVFPKNVKGSLGLVLCIHGGGWVEGSKDAYTGNLFQVSEEKGIAAACTDPKVAGDSLLPTNKLGTPEIGKEVYEKMYKLWRKDFESDDGYTNLAMTQGSKKEK